MAAALLCAVLGLPNVQGTARLAFIDLSHHFFSSVCLILVPFLHVVPFSQLLIFLSTLPASYPLCVPFLFKNPVTNTKMEFHFQGCQGTCDGSSVSSGPCNAGQASEWSTWYAWFVVPP